MNGRFIVIEGPDGAGTTTNSNALADYLRNKGHDVLHTFEATDGPIGTFIREKLRSGGLPGNAMQLLFTADRAWHEQKVIKPALEAGKTIICDRYSLSTVIYGTAFGFERAWLEDMNSRFIQPDLMLLALPPLSVCMERLGIREKDTFEADDTLQKRVYDLYREYAETMPVGHVIDTSMEKERTAEAFAAAVSAAFGI